MERIETYSLKAAFSTCTRKEVRKTIVATSTGSSCFPSSASPCTECLVLGCPVPPYHAVPSGFERYQSSADDFHTQTQPSDEIVQVQYYSTVLHTTVLKYYTDTYRAAIKYTGHLPRLKNKGQYILYLPHGLLNTE